LKNKSPITFKKEIKTVKTSIVDCNPKLEIEVNNLENNAETDLVTQNIKRIASKNDLISTKSNNLFGLELNDLDNIDYDLNVESNPNYVDRNYITKLADEVFGDFQEYKYIDSVNKDHYDENAFEFENQEY